MSFPITLYRNDSAPNVVNKKIEAVSSTITQGTLRDGTSITDPVIVIQANAPGFHKNHCNYLYIEEFERYYYITNIVSINYTLWEIHCHVDVLMSFAEKIKEQQAIVSKQQGKFNLMLDDGSFMCYQNPKVQTKVFSVSEPFEHQEFVLVVAGS